MPDLSFFESYKGLEVVPSARAADEPTSVLTSNFETLAERAPYNSTVNPASGNDDVNGFVAGNLWLNTTTGTIWMCVSAATGAAVWQSFCKRTTAALTLIPEESSHEVNVAGHLKITGTDGGGTGLKVSGPATSVVLENSGTAAMTLLINSYPTGNQTAQIQMRNISSPGNDRTLISRFFDSSSTTPDYFRIQHLVDGATKCVAEITNTGKFRVEPQDDVNFSGSGMGNFGIGTATPKTKLHSTGSTILGANTSAVADADLGNGQVNFWVNQSTHQLTLKVKYSDGTLKTGVVSLT